jgi:hypothetical protein
VNQHNRAVMLIAVIGDVLPEIEELGRVIDEAQNEPPLGGADGSMDEDTWRKMVAVINSGTTLRHALAEARKIQRKPEKKKAR